MLQLAPQSRIFLATDPVDFRKGIDGLVAVCRQVLGDNPLSGAVYVFRNRSSTAIKLLFYDGQGFLALCQTLVPGTLPLVAPRPGRELPPLCPRAAGSAVEWVSPPGRDG